MAYCHFQQEYIRCKYLTWNQGNARVYYTVCHPRACSIKGSFSKVSIVYLCKCIFPPNVLTWTDLHPSPCGPTMNLTCLSVSRIWRTGDWVRAKANWLTKWFCIQEIIKSFKELFSAKFSFIACSEPIRKLLGIIARF
jgi:hypothetical protein